MKKFPSHMNFFEASKINLGFLLCYFQKNEYEIKVTQKNKDLSNISKETIWYFAI